MQNAVRSDFLGSVVIAQARAKRPSDFLKKRRVAAKCPFCRGNEAMTPPTILALPDEKRWQVRCFENLFPALSKRFAQAYGAHEIVVDTPLHGKRLGAASAAQLRMLLDAYVRRTSALSRDKKIKYVFVFRNSGADAGASLAHEHSQIVALPFVPFAAFHELNGNTRYYEKTRRCFYCEAEKRRALRVFATEHFTCECPFASRWSFEMLLAPKRHVQQLGDLSGAELDDLAAALRKALAALDALLENPPYNMLVHNAPVHGAPRHHLHVSITPRLSVPAGLEFGTGVFVNTMAPELAARELRNVVRE